ncbi:Rhodanese-related sulfurtransferase [Natronorubrum sediminis]|uniref:Rhodanese-related sulfurtransferase n=1 Tax=Natronorubrum sediminis TaxID=640943 RepID=A0A1H6G1A3_9EURY|nr:rhodanese-like domain-containing protein [Natronorubrum sediminis]SEH16839.1 Rhodanese-related sulfurtransferase [Natronorubrum sediminis]
MDGEITTDEVNELLEDDEDICIVDIRSPQEFTHSHIPDSENVPFHELSSRVEELADEDHIVTVCPHGKASVQAAKLIGTYEGTADARIESMEGGLEKYGMKFGLVRDRDDEDEAEQPESPF